ncbi:MAG: zinc-binding alcohol dehydrogenase family protein [Sedimentibacter sp.]|uniref:zinc-binding alcohol dehydrogenase family protein n=1 Tax=Sedimentibacter sp. TaxID=1960295 RepID=UPI0031590783
MKYVSMAEPKKVEIKTGNKPKPKKGEALLRIIYGGICGSDMGLYKGHMDAYASYPRIPGHELSAEIVEIEENEYGLKEGTIVTVNPYFNCHECYSCERGFVNCCVHNKTMGLAIDGGFAEYITMPIERIYDGKGLNAKTLVLIEPFCISYHAVKRANVQPGEKVLVVGAGTIGIFALMAAKLKGAEVYISDVVEQKLAFAQKMGADGVIFNDNNENFKEKVDAITDGKGFDVLIEAVGHPMTMMNCIDGAAHMARIVEVGISSRKMDFDFSIVQRKELNIFGSRNALKEDFIELIDIVRSGRIDISPMITNMYDIDQTAQAFEDLDRNIGNNLKTIIKF